MYAYELMVLMMASSGGFNDAGRRGRGRRWNDISGFIVSVILSRDIGIISIGRGGARGEGYQRN